MLLLPPALKLPLRYVKSKSKNRLRDEEPMDITMDTEILVSLTRKFSNNILIPR